MSTLLRFVSLTSMLLVFGFSVFGYLATFESSDYWPLRVFYAGVGLLCVAGACWIGARRERLPLLRST